MSASEQYTGPERRQRDEWQIAMEKRLDEVEGEIKKNTDKTEHIESDIGGMKTQLNEVELKIRHVNHGLANNTQITEDTSRRVRGMGEKVDAGYRLNQNVFALVEGLDALNKLTRIAMKASKPILWMAGLWLTFRSFFK